MSIAANAVSDLIAPTLPRAAASASYDDHQAPSFQQHLDNASPAKERPAPSSNTKQEARASAAPSSDPSNESAAAAKAPSANDNTDVQEQTASRHPPVLVQLIASAPTPLGAGAEEDTGKQNAAEAGKAEDANAAPPLITVAAPAPPIPAPKPNGAARPQVKGASTKDAPKEATPASGDGAPDASTSPAPQAIAAIATPVTAPPTASGNNSDQQEAIGAIADSKARSPTQPSPPEPATPNAAQAPTITPEGQPSQRDADAAKATPRNSAKDIAQADALKQLAQDAAAPAPKPQMAASTLPSATHAQLAAPVQQAVATDGASPPAAAQVGGEIIRRFNGQDTSFQLRLDPPELGRVDVRLDVSRDHRVTAIISADTPQALSELARGARDLQQALQSAGLDLADDGLRFDLSSNGQGGSFAQAQADQPNWRTAPTTTPNQATTPEPIATRPLSIDSWRGGRVDLVA